MTALEQLYTVKPSSGIKEVLLLMRNHSLNQVPVVDGGHIVGWIDREYLLRILQVHSEAGR
jgi:predicted transcriptional regulator